MALTEPGEGCLLIDVPLYLLHIAILVPTDQPGEPQQGKVLNETEGEIPGMEELGIVLCLEKHPTLKLVLVFSKCLISQLTWNLLPPEMADCLLNSALVASIR